MPSAKKLTLATTALVAAPFAAQAQDEPITINWWHAMGGSLGEQVDAIAQDFNEHQDRYEVVTNYRGNYSETMTGAISAFRAGEQPHIVQVFEVGTANMMAAEGAIKPVHEMMKETGNYFNSDDFLDAVVGYYTTPEGDMLSMPFNSSTPVMWYNKDAFREAGLDPENPPATWEEMDAALQQIVDSGAAECGFTSTWQSWIQLENFSAIHDVPFASNANGFESFEGTELQFNSDLHKKHIGQLAEWQREGIFQYGGRGSDGSDLFVNGTCAVMTESSAGYAGVKSGADFDFGVAPLPYWASAVEEPNNSIIGGATLWTFGGHSQEEYEGVAEFFAYLSSTPVQAEWHQETGYLPITSHAATYTRGQGFYRENPGTDVAGEQMMGRGEVTENSKGLRLGNFLQIRDIINSELEAVWSGDKSAGEALDAAVEAGNEQLRRFEQNM